jgi:hypothetical protein
MTTNNDSGALPGQLAVLHIEDNNLDAELVAKALRKSGFSISVAVVQNEADFEREIRLHLPTSCLPITTCRNGKAWKHSRC